MYGPPLGDEGATFFLDDVNVPEGDTAVTPSTNASGKRNNFVGLHEMLVQLLETSCWHDSIGNKACRLEGLNLVACSAPDADTVAPMPKRLVAR